MALGKTVRQLLDETDSRELAEWEAYDRLEPFGETRADLRAGIIASTVAAGYPRKHSRPMYPRDFMPTFGHEAGREPDENVAEQVRAVFGALRKGDR